MKLADLNLDTQTVTISHLVITSGSGRQELKEVTAAFVLGFIFVERFLNGQVVVNAYPASAVELAEDIQAVSSLTW
jgi:hypothetical protein